MDNGSKIVFLFLLFFSIILHGCKKREINPIVEGTISLKVKISHHSVPVQWLPLFLKSNTKVFPGTDTSFYDMRATTDEFGSATFSKLYPGQYYLFGTGRDSITHENVIGYKPVSLDSSTIINNLVEEQLYVSE